MALPSTDGNDMESEKQKEDRRAFFKTLGRGLVLGVTGAGVAAMIRSGRINTCIQELSPCTTCVVLKQGCELPKAASYRKEQGNGKL